MTIDTIDPIRDLPANISEASLREYATALVRGGVGMDAVNESLVKRGAKPLDAGSSEAALAIRDGILANPATRQAIVDGTDTASLTELTMLEMRAAKNAGTKMANLDPRAEEFLPAAVTASLNLDNGQATDEYVQGLSQLAADLQLDAVSAKSLMENHIEAARYERSASVDPMYGQIQERDFLNVLGASAEAQIAEANTILTRLRSNGAKMDLKTISRSNGAIVALQLLHVAQTHKTSVRT